LSAIALPKPNVATFLNHPPFSPTAGPSSSSIYRTNDLPSGPNRVIHVMTAFERDPKETIMTTFTKDTDNNITAHGTSEEAAATPATPFDSFASQNELAELAARSRSSRTGPRPLPGFRKSIQGQGESVKPNPTQPAKPKAARKAKGVAQSAQGAPTKGKAIRRPPPRTRPRANGPLRCKKPPRRARAAKTAQVVVMLQRQNGATLAEIMEKMSWQKHTIRGFMAGAMKKAGFTVASFKPEGGERT
jgi:hypothetical protein